MRRSATNISPSSEDRRADTAACTCGWPEKPCLRRVLDNGPPFPPEPCEPKVETSPAATPALHPDFKMCGNCGADAARFVTWDNADGWCCSNCGGCDSDE